MILGGSFGNFFDRIYYFAVPDFVDLHIGNFHWFIFNIADIFITIGVICLILVEIFSKNINKELMQKILNKIIIIIFFFITACATSWKDVKKGLGGGKRTSTDEFLVKKKILLLCHQNGKNLPKPGGVKYDNQKTNLKRRLILRNLFN